MGQYEDVIKVIKDTFRDIAKDVYEDSQVKCPKNQNGTNELRNSGVFDEATNSVGLVYTAPYADVVENGQKESSQVVGRYTRRDGTTVRPHIQRVPEKKGVHFIQTSVEEQETRVESRVDSALRNNFKVK
jgi:hypothetical protein